MSLSQSQTCISSENLFSLQGNNSSVCINCNKKLKNHKGLKIHNSKCHPQVESSPSANTVAPSTSSGLPGFNRLLGRYFRFGRGRRPRGPTYARGTIRSLFEDQEQATQRTAYDVATRPPCRNLFWGRSFRNNSVCLCRQSIHFEFIGSGFIFVYRITFSFISVSLSVSLSVFVCFFRGFFRVFIVESLCQPVLGRLESHMLAPKF
jgi:hypothetical protein